MELEDDVSPSLALGLQEHELSFLDALPYIDEYTTEDRTRALNLIERELLNAQLPEVEEVQVNFNSEMLNELFQQYVESNGEYNLSGIDLERYNVEQPDGKRLKLWEKAVHDIRVLDETLEIHLENLDLSNSYGDNAWIKYNEYLETVKKRLEEILNSTKKDINSINLKRKNAQTNGLKKLKLLEERLSPPAYQ